MWSLQWALFSNVSFLAPCFAIIDSSVTTVVDTAYMASFSISGTSVNIPGAAVVLGSGGSHFVTRASSTSGPKIPNSLDHFAKHYFQRVGILH